MNAIPLTRHLLLKDLRHQRAWLALLWGFALLLPVMARLLNGTSDGAMPLAVIGFFVLIVLALGQLVQLDSPGRKLTFLATRPVPWNVLLAEKTLFIALFLLVPVWIAKFGTIVLLKIPVGGKDVAALLLENTLHVAAFLAVAAVFACFFGNMWMAFLFMIGTAVLILVCGAYFAFVSFNRGFDTTEQQAAVGNSRLLVLTVSLIAVAGVTAILRYRTRAILKPALALAAGLLLCGVLTNEWNYDLTQLFRPTQPAAELPAQQRDAIHFALKGNAGNSDSGTSNGIRYCNITQEITLEGVEPPYFATLTDYHAVATLKSGRTIQAGYHSANAVIRTHQMMGMLSDQMMRSVAGFKPDHESPHWNPTTVEIFNYLPGDFQSEDLSGATISGTLTLEIRKLVVAKTMPFASGGRLNFPRKTYVMSDAVVTPGGAGCKIVCNSVSSALLGDNASPFDWDLMFLVYNRAKNECLTRDGNTGNGTAGMFYSVYTTRQQFRQDSGAPGKGQQPLAADWAQGAEISFFDSQPCGRVSFPYESRNVDLGH